VLAGKALAAVLPLPSMPRMTFATSLGFHSTASIGAPSGPLTSWTPIDNPALFQRRRLKIGAFLVVRM
jgi:hypothetical protein